MAELKDDIDRLAHHPLNNHRGPYRFCITRPHKSKVRYTTEWLKGEVEKADVEDEARALLADPRDTIISVWAWSVREECFVIGYK